MNVITIEEPPFNRREALRYAACPQDAGDMPLDECFAMTHGQLSCRVVWEETECTVSGDTVDFGFAAVHSAGLARSIIGCSRAIIFGATVGLGMDRLITRYERVSPTYALLLHAIGTERIESVCDAFVRITEERLAPDGWRLRPRFSPGYGDLPITFQREIFSFLSCEKHIGLTLTPSCMMSPTKSVTAIAGITKGYGTHAPEGCAVCTQAHCDYRGFRSVPRCSDPPRAE